MEAANTVAGESHSNLSDIGLRGNPGRLAPRIWLPFPGLVLLVVGILFVGFQSHVNRGPSRSVPRRVVGAALDRVSIPAPEELRVLGLSILSEPVRDHPPLSLTGLLEEIVDPVPGVGYRGTGTLFRGPPLSLAA